ncbi:hypothetical protein A1Q2_06272 [Trichosporon asahii var. asahii CBS 8904]|uniref:Uncharacterized protein n=1 Tax=Trichosporon asahii var. asahii (strain CBS 8904) TaxID=1220162 RepID=K1VER4_TRIAC|nr:hypothetical protein A1Q2_06272 [Trichosporon asahii var. asahii CBS 8904]
MPYVSPKDLSVSSTPTPRSAAASPPPKQAMTEPVESLAAALAKSQLEETYDSPPALSECATTSTNSVQTLQSESTPPEVEVASPSQSPKDMPDPTDAVDPEAKRLDVLPAQEADAVETRSAEDDEREHQHHLVEEIRAGIEGEETVVQDPPSGTALDAVPADADQAELSKLAQYSQAIYEFTMKLYVRAEKESIAKGHTLPGELPPPYGLELQERRGGGTRGHTPHRGVT